MCCYLLKKDKDLWVEEVGVKKIEKLPKEWKDMDDFTFKINDIIDRLNSLPPADKIMVKE